MKIKSKKPWPEPTHFYRYRGDRLRAEVRNGGDVYVRGQYLLSRPLATKKSTRLIGLPQITADQPDVVVNAHERAWKRDFMDSWAISERIREIVEGKVEL